MSRVAYVNGRYLPHRQATVHVEDRGYQFADGIYEVIEVRGGGFIDEDRHLARLVRSLGELRIAAPVGTQALRVVLREVVARNKVRHGAVYFQVTRGVARRDHIFPDPAVPSSLVVTAKSIDPAAAALKAAKGIRVITTPDMRWKRPDIKTISLTANVLAKQAAKERGAAEAWLIDADGLVTEGGSSNAWIVDGEGTAITHPVSNAILQGVTRTTLLSLLSSLGRRVVERRFSPAEAYAAQEAFVTSATSIVTPVVAVDDRTIGAGIPGPIAQDLRRRFHEVAQHS